MKETLRQSMAWLHTWGGLLVGWVLFFIFLTGTLSYVRFEIDHWMMPEKPFVATSLNEAQLLSQVSTWLHERAPDAERWTIETPDRRTGGDLKLSWTSMQDGNGGQSKTHREIVNVATGLPHAEVIRDAGGGAHLYEMHFSLHYMPPMLAILLVGICTMFMLVAIISGIITHKKIFADFFTFRPRKGQRSWLDAHNVLAVTALPFHLMITWSGLLIYMTIYMPFLPFGVHGTDLPKVQQIVLKDTLQTTSEVWSSGPLPDAPPAALAPLAPMATYAQNTWGRQGLHITVRNPGRANAEVSISARQGISDRSSMLTFDGVTGVPVNDAGSRLSPPVQLHGAAVGLHVAAFAGPLLRVLFVLSGLAGTAMIGTGLVLWTKKREAKLKETDKPHFGIAVVNRLNVGTIAGLPVAIAAYFWANRLLPLDFPGRHDGEVHVMYMVWAATFLWAVVRPLRRSWSELLAVGALAYGSIPVLNALTTDRHLAASVPQGDWVMAGFDLICLATGALLGGIAWKLHCRAQTQLPLRQTGIAR